MTSPQKAKGSGFEREVAKFLSALYESSFIRAPGSGAYIGGKNQVRTEVLHDGQIRSFKGDIIPGEEFTKFNAEAKFYADFAFHLLWTGKHKVLDDWIKQMTDVAEPGDVNILFMKFNRIGKFVVVSADLTWKADNFFLYESDTHGGWLIVEFDKFFELNKDLFKAYCTGENSSTETDNVN